jgi:putative endonuclease
VEKEYGIRSTASFVGVKGGIWITIYYVYILNCINRKSGRESLYTGSTQDLKKRIDQHQDGRGAQYTKGKDLKLVYFETYLTRGAAMSREYEIKSFNLKQKKELVKNFHKTLEQ